MNNQIYNNKTILITGGTGSFGKTLVNDLLKNSKPKKIIIFSRDELKQYDMFQNYTKKQNDIIRYFIGDVRDLERLKLAFQGVDFVVHAAAMKQVPASEYNPMECIKTNINGANNVIQAAIYNNIKKVIALSTDKASSPINLYGASKLASDKLFIAGNHLTGKKKCVFSVVRYGNVAGSRGSIIPYFKKLIKNKSKYFPITSIEMTRFIIKLEDSVNFVNSSFARMHGGEIFIPKLPSILITDLAKAMAPELKQKIIGIRAGEKIHEQMISYDDSLETLEFNNFYIIKPTIRIHDNKNIYKKTKLNEQGKITKKSFCYDSGSNKKYLSTSEIKKLVETLHDPL